MDLLINPDTWDLVFVNGACPVVNERVDVVVQRLGVRLRTFLEEWFINTTYGIPYLQRLLGKKVPKEVVDQIMQENILAEEGVAEIISFNSTLSTSRIYALTFKVRCTDNTNVTVTLNELGV